MATVVTHLRRHFHVVRVLEKARHQEAAVSGPSFQGHLTTGLKSKTLRGGKRKRKYVHIRAHSTPRRDYTIGADFFFFYSFCINGTLSLVPEKTGRKKRPFPSFPTFSKRVISDTSEKRRKRNTAKKIDIIKIRNRNINTSAYTACRGVF